MRITARQTRTRTLTDLYRAIDHQHAVTVRYTDRDGITTLRTVEIHEVRTTKSGGILLVVMCRKAHADLLARQTAGEDTGTETAERHLTLARVSEYTVHRIGFTLDRPEATSPAGRGIVARSEQQLIARELGRDYHPTRRITRDQTSLAA